MMTKMLIHFIVSSGHRSCSTPLFLPLPQLLDCIVAVCRVLVFDVVVPLVLVVFVVSSCNLLLLDHNDDNITTACHCYYFIISNFYNR